MAGRGSFSGSSNRSAPERASPPGGREVSRTGGAAARDGTRTGTADSRNSLIRNMNSTGAPLTATAPSAPEPTVRTPTAPLPDSLPTVDEEEARRRLLSTAKNQKAPTLLGITASLLG